MFFGLLQKPRAFYLYLSEFWRRASRKIAIGRISSWRFAGSTPKRLLVAPTDLRIADPYIASEIYAGRFPFAGRVLETHGHSPFKAQLPSHSFANELHNFRWLRHLRSANHKLAFSNARALLDDWINEHGVSLKGVAWENDIVAKRLISWLSHSTIVLKDADYHFYHRFLKSLSFQIRYLHAIAPNIPDGDVQLHVRIALAMASLVIPTSPRKIRLAARNLDVELKRQILPDGSHISRNPQVPLNLLEDLLPLRQTYANQGHNLPTELIVTIDRIFPALRFFKHADGELAAFNGRAAFSMDKLLSVLRYDETAGTIFRTLRYGGYQRLQQNRTIIIADTGAPPPSSFSKTAHSGYLSFEMSSGANRFIVNCGQSENPSDEIHLMARSTAAHSTLCFDNASSSKVSKSKFLGPIFVGKPLSVRVEEADLVDTQGDHSILGFRARHNGYLAQYGVIHERRISLSQQGNVIEGHDKLLDSRGNSFNENSQRHAIVRFHLQLTLSVAQHENGDIHLTASDGETWAFSCSNIRPILEESIIFTNVAGPKKALQIVLNISLDELTEANWKLIKIQNS